MIPASLVASRTLEITFLTMSVLASLELLELMLERWKMAVHQINTATVMTMGIATFLFCMIGCIMACFCLDLCYNMTL